MLNVKAYFDDIHQVILKYINAAQEEIKIAVAWFTDSELFDALCKKAQQRVKINLILIKDDINCGVRRLNFVRLQNLKGEVNFLETENFNKMHHKFCVIDKKIVITGSYNWTNQARNNDENITVFEGDADICNDFLTRFEKLFNPTTGNTVVDISPDVVKRRLEMIKNFILLGETEDIFSQLDKLKPIIQNYSLESIQNALEQGQYQQAVEKITLYLRNFSALIVSEDLEIMELKFELKILELRHESISNEQSDIERDLALFNHRQYEILGGLVSEILRLKADYFNVLKELAEKENKQTVEERKEEAEQEYNDYSQKIEEIQQKAIAKLDEISEKELKTTFRKACNLCHPDKVPDSKKEEASRIFIELKEAYDDNDIVKVKEVYRKLQQGDFSQTQSTTLKAVDLLRAAIADMKYRIEQNLKILQSLKSDSVVKTIQSIGDHEESWISFLTSKRVQLEQERLNWLEKISELKQGESYE